MILCNPMPIAYKYQHPLHGKFAYREAADPTIVRFKGKYFLFTSKCGGFYWSENLNEWRFHEDRTLDIHGYAPDVSVDGEYMYFCASAYLSKCRIWRSKDPFKGFEVVSRPFAFWDPHILFDEKRAYLFWGCSSKQPIFGIELDKKTMTPVGDKVPIVSGDPERHGIDDKSVYAGEKRSLWQRYIALFTGSGTFIEGAYVRRQILFSIRYSRHGISHIRRRRSDGGQAARKICMAKTQSFFRSARRLYAGCGARQHVRGRVRQPLARRQRMRGHQPQLRAQAGSTL